MDIIWIMLASMLVSAEYPNQQYHAFTGVGAEFSSYDACMEYLYDPENAPAIAGTLTMTYGKREIHNVICVDQAHVHARQDDPKLNVSGGPGIPV